MFSTALAIIRAIVSLMPILEQVIMTAETVMPVGTPGGDKLEFARKLIESAYNAEQSIEAPFTNVWPVLSTVISHLVPVFTKKLAPVEDHSNDAVIVNKTNGLMPPI